MCLEETRHLRQYVQVRSFVVSWLSIQLYGRSWRVAVSVHFSMERRVELSIARATAQELRKEYK